MNTVKLRRSRTLAAFALAIGLLVAFQPRQVVAEKAATTAPPPPTIAFEKIRLENGLELIHHVDESLPLVAVNVWYHVGPANEPVGRSGFAHLFEHLMFEGSRHVGREFDRLLETAGATNVNGTTSWDRTNYYETVPREHLELALWIESDRMGFMLDTLTPERLEVQRGVVKNERRQSYEDSPYGPSTLAMLDALFPVGHPYHGAVIGSMKDLSAATMDDVKQFFERFYAPSNATLVVAGDSDPVQTKAWVRKYFGALPSRPRPPRRVMTTQPLVAPKRLVVDEPVQLTKISMGWITPPAYSTDDTALDVAMAVLAGGKATRLYRQLVVEKKVASEVDASVDSNRLASTAFVSALAASGTDEKELESEIARALAALATTGPDEKELHRAKRRIRVELLGDLQLLNGPGGESGRAGLLQRFNHYFGDPGMLERVLGGLEAVTAADVKRVISTHLTPETRVTVVTRPKKEQP